MNPFKEFNHFIAYFVPGVLIFVLLLFVVSILIGRNFLSHQYFSSYIFITLIGGTISGLFLDEMRHSSKFFEERLENKWAEKENYDITKIDDFVVYIPKLGIDLYKLIRDEYYYFYEFDINISIALFLTAITAPLYLYFFYSVNQLLVIGLFVALFLAGFLFWKFGINAYQCFLNTFINAVEKVEPGFKQKIKKS